MKSFDFIRLIENKYKVFLSHKNPVIIRLDGQSCTAAHDLGMLSFDKGNFTYSLIKATAYFCEKFRCMSLFGLDEVSFIIPDPRKIIDYYKTDNIVDLNALFSQEFLLRFNKYYTEREIVFHSRLFSLKYEYLDKYIWMRQSLIKNNYMIYYFKEFDIPVSKKVKYKENDELLSVHPQYKNRNNYFICGAIIINNIAFSPADYKDGSFNERLLYPLLEINDVICPKKELKTGHIASIDDF